MLINSKLFQGDNFARCCIDKGKNGIFLTLAQVMPKRNMKTGFSNLKKFK